MSGVPNTPNNSTLNDDSPIENGFVKARVVCDYETDDITELSLSVNEVISVIFSSGEYFFML